MASFPHHEDLYGEAVTDPTSQTRGDPRAAALPSDEEDFAQKAVAACGARLFALLLQITANVQRADAKYHILNKANQLVFELISVDPCVERVLELSGFRAAPQLSVG